MYVSLLLNHIALLLFIVPLLVGGQLHIHNGNQLQSQQHMQQHLTHATHTISNGTISGTNRGCEHRTQYYITQHVSFPMCMGHSGQDLKNGMSIINLINSRGYLPTCRVLQLMLWMVSDSSESGLMSKDFFIDIGANIGSCTVHMAALGYPVVSVEPVKEHVDTIKGSMEINPSFHIDLQHIGLSVEDRSIKANFGHGARNWGASEFHEVKDDAEGGNASFELQLQLKTLDQVVGHRRVALMKVDCEGCEWETLKSAKRSLRRIPMIKMELVQQEYTAGNETVNPNQILHFLNNSRYSIYADHWNEQDMYFGNHGKEERGIDKIFGSAKWKLNADVDVLRKSAQTILLNPIDPFNFNHREFLKRHTDIIAIEQTLAVRMKARYL